MINDGEPGVWGFDPQPYQSLQGLMPSQSYVGEDSPKNYA